MSVAVEKFLLHLEHVRRNGAGWMARCPAHDYRLTLRAHLRPFFGHLELTAIEPADLDAYIAGKTGDLSPKTISNHLGLLRVMFKVARRWRLVQHNPVDEVEAPGSSSAR